LTWLVVGRAQEAVVSGTVSDSTGAVLPRVTVTVAATTHELLKMLLGTKSAEWTHEGEWRFVLPDRIGYLKSRRY